jgi:hypothetical protein
MYLWPMRVSIRLRIGGQVQNGACAVKLDMHKAYERVEWVFLENIMRQLGFAKGGSLL